MFRLFPSCLIRSRACSASGSSGWRTMNSSSASAVPRLRASSNSSATAIFGSRAAGVVLAGPVAPRSEAVFCIAGVSPQAFAEPRPAPSRTAANATNIPDARPAAYCLRLLELRGAATRHDRSGGSIDCRAGQHHTILQPYQEELMRVNRFERTPTKGMHCGGTNRLERPFNSE
jgi:hypothetical protein